MGENKSNFQLPNNIEQYLAALSKLYLQEGRTEKLEIIVNSQVRIHEEYTYNNWNGGTYGHAIFLTLPAALYLSCLKRKSKLQKEIQADINNLHNVPDEFFGEVFFEMEALGDRDWRRESGALQSGQRVVMPDASKRIWGIGGYRIFLSHKTEVKREAAELKNQMGFFGISAFVAHEDIVPTEEWQDEIENALASMDAFVALMSGAFHESFWTDQEVGYAVGRGVPLVAVRLERDPYGFIGKFQALSCGWDTTPVGLVRLFINYPKMLDAYIEATEQCHSFDTGNKLSDVLPNISKVTEQQASRLCKAFNENFELRGSFGFNGGKPVYYGKGLAVHLSRATGEQYVVTDAGEIQKK